MWISKRRHNEKLAKERDRHWRELDEQDQNNKIDQLKKEVKEIRKLVKQLKKNIGEY